MQRPRPISHLAIAVQSFRSISALLLREMSTSYGRSPGGYIWAILEPVAGTALLALVFSLAFETPPLGLNFPLFYATGILPFMMYVDLSTKVMQSIQFSKQLLTYPRVSFLDAIAARFILNLITQILVVALVFWGLLQVFALTPILDFHSIFAAMSMSACLGLGVGIMNCYLISAFPVWLRVWAILNRPMFIISCIFFLPENLPRQYMDILLYNPLVHVVGEMRTGFYPSYNADYVSQIYIYLLSISLAAIGLLLLRKYHRDILNM